MTIAISTDRLAGIFGGQRAYSQLGGDLAGCTPPFDQSFREAPLDDNFGALSTNRPCRALAHDIAKLGAR